MSTTRMNWTRQPLTRLQRCSILELCEATGQDAGTVCHHRYNTTLDKLTRMQAKATIAALELQETVQGWKKTPWSND